MELRKESTVLQLNLYVSPIQLQQAATCFIAHKRRYPENIQEFILFATPLLTLNSLEAIYSSLGAKLPPCTLLLMSDDAAGWVLDTFKAEMPEYKLQLGTGEPDGKC